MMQLATPRTWLRSPGFDLQLQLGALLGVAPALLVHAAFDAERASSYLSLATLVAIPFIHVFGSFFYAFSAERNRSDTPPPRLFAIAAVWVVAVLVLSRVAPRGLATFALLYGGWHIARQNFGLLRELSHKAGLAADPTLRRLDSLATLTPAIALWVLISTRGPWRFIAADVHHLPLPAWLLWAAFLMVPASLLVRELWLRRLVQTAGRPSPSVAGLLLLTGNAAALLVPALLLDELTLIYTLAASYHGFQYLAYLSGREHDRQARDPLSVGTSPILALLPLAGAVALMMMLWFVVLLGAGWLLGPSVAEQVLLAAWYCIVPFHYFVDGQIWRRPRPSRSEAPPLFLTREPTCTESSS
jgi:hypothetical protein